MDTEHWTQYHSESFSSWKPFISIKCSVHVRSKIACDPRDSPVPNSIIIIQFQVKTNYIRNPICFGWQLTGTFRKCHFCGQLTRIFLIERSVCNLLTICDLWQTCKLLWTLYFRIQANSFTRYVNGKFGIVYVKCKWNFKCICIAIPDIRMC